MKHSRFSFKSIVWKLKSLCTLGELFSLFHLFFVDGAENVAQLAEILQCLLHGLLENL
jgi:hypothetical protein